MSEPVTLNAATDREGRLIWGDEGFVALNGRAGGRTGATIAVPALADLVRLARRLGVGIGRGVTIADEGVDLDCWIDATPVDSGVTVAAALLRERSAWRPVARTPAGGDVAPPPGAAWTWETDAELRLVHVEEGAAARYGFDPGAMLAAPVSRLFVLEPNAEGGLPILDAMAARRDFDGQPATVRGGGQRVTLAGSVRLDVGGGFAGFVAGTYPALAEPVVAALDPLASRGVTAAFHARLDQILRAPLGRIVAHAETINAAADGPLDPHYVDYAADIASAGRHLLGLVDDLVDLEAIEREDFSVAREEVDLSDVVRRAAGLLSVRAAEAGVELDRSDLDRPLVAAAEFRRTLQIVVNLIGNALRYSPRGGTIWLRLRREDDRAILIVADQGKGIAAEDQARIFAKFGRVDPAEPGGSGLGLYIARRLARAMAGELTVDSAPGTGARFVLTLPAGAVEPAA
jgi:signal transduction histidine kinase